MSGDASSVRPSITITIAFASSSATRAWRKISDGISLFFGDDAAGIDNAHLAAVPLGFAVNPVAGDAGLVADDGAPRAHQPVEQRRLADIRPADDGQGAPDGRWFAPLERSGWTRIACDGPFRVLLI